MRGRRICAACRYFVPEDVPWGGRKLRVGIWPL